MGGRTDNLLGGIDYRFSDKVMAGVYVFYEDSRLETAESVLESETEISARRSCLLRPDAERQLGAQRRYRLLGNFDVAGIIRATDLTMRDNTSPGATSQF